MTYFVKINGVSEGPFTEQELFIKFDGILPAHTPCAQVGNRSWSTLGDLFMEWKDTGVRKHSGLNFDAGEVSNARVGLYDPPPREGRLPGHYPALKFYRKFLRFIAVVAAVNLVWQLVLVLFIVERHALFVDLLKSIVEDVAVMVVNLALAESITVLLDIEENTRKPVVQPKSQLPPEIPGRV